jgi:hypothetical protein
MCRRLLRWLTPLLVLGYCWLPAALAQRRMAASQDDAASSTKSFPFAYTVAFVATMIIMVIICAPTRKAWRD